MPSVAPAALLLTVLTMMPEGGDVAYRWWPPEQREAQATLERALNAVPAPASLRKWHDLLAAEPHVAGTPGDEHVIQKLVDAFTAMGLQAQTQEIWPLLVRPIEARVAIIMAPAPTKPSEEAALPIILPLKETALEEDPYSSHAELTSGWNAYSGSGDVTAEVVYANYGSKEDFATLRKLGVNVQGKIVLARYGKLFRGYKSKFAQEAGAAGVLLYTDPGDSGYAQGPVWPEGGWANESMIQRGSLLTLDYPGDPLTPDEPATKDAARLDASVVALPRIPVQPLGYGAAEKILSRMRGRAVPRNPEGWQGGLPFTYRLEGGPRLLVRLTVRQERAITRTANVIATLPGTTWPEQSIIIGCHHDAWAYGAADPLAGTILVLEAARSFAELARQGHRPARTIIFAAWGAEEFGIIGSTEWCEANRQSLTDGGVAYVNLDMATMGTQFNCAASPTLRTLIEEVTKAVPQAGESTGRSVYGATLAAQAAKASDPARTPGEPSAAAGSGQLPFGNLGGGSDHVGFLCHLGIPSCSFGAGGSEGTSYHSNYDDLAWYRRVVGEDYEPAVMLTRIVNLFASRLAEAPFLPLDPTRYGPDIREHLKTNARRGTEMGIALDIELLERQLKDLESEATATQSMLMAAAQAGRSDAPTVTAVNRSLVAMERSWLEPDGLPDRPWYRNLYAATDPETGYDAWMLPLMRWGIETGDPIAAAYPVGVYMNAVQRVGERLGEIRQAIGPRPGNPRAGTHQEQ